MTTYIAKRLLMLLPVLLGISVTVFLIIHLIPGNPAQLMLGERATPEALAALEKQLGLDQPLHVQFFRFLGRVLTGDLGRSIRSNKPVISELAERFPATIELSFFSMFVAVVVGVSAGIISAVKRYSLFDHVSMFLALIGVSMPIFWLGLMLIWFFSVNLGWFPPSSRLDVRFFLETYTNFYLIDSLLNRNLAAFLNALWHLVMPALALGTIPMAIIARMTRSSMLEVLGQDYIRTARAKGLAQRVVVFRHALKNALLPVVTIVGLQFGFLLGGAILTETIFSWPGVGRYIIEGINERDYPVVQGTVLLIATTFVFVNLLVDILYTFIDPRIRYG